jgi:uncharacterized membrane protein
MSTTDTTPPQARHTVEVDLPRDAAWRYWTHVEKELPGMRTQVTQNVTVHGDTGDAAAVAAELAQTMPTGMARLAAAMKRCVDADVPPRQR